MNSIPLFDLVIFFPLSLVVSKFYFIPPPHAHTTRLFENGLNIFILYQHLWNKTLSLKVSITIDVQVLHGCSFLTHFDKYHKSRVLWAFFQEWQHLLLFSLLSQNRSLSEERLALVHSSKEHSLVLTRRTRVSSVALTKKEKRISEKESFLVFTSYCIAFRDISRWRSNVFP